MRCLSVPVGPGLQAVAALSVSGPASRLAPGDPAVLAAMRGVADDLAAWLGTSPGAAFSALRK